MARRCSCPRRGPPCCRARTAPTTGSTKIRGVKRRDRLPSEGQSRSTSGRSTVDVGYFDPTDIGASLFLDGRRNYSREFLVDTTQHTTKSRAPYVRTNTVLFGIHTNSAHPDRIRVDAHRCQCQVRICSRCGRGQLIAHPRSPPERAAATSSFIWAASTTPGTSVSPTTKAGVPPMRSCRASARTSPR